MAKFSYNAKVFDGSPLYASSIATQVTVIDKVTSTLATIWEDFDGITLKSNPFNIDEAGIIQFYADAGRYDITAVNGPNSDTVPDYILGEAGGGGGQVDSVVAGDAVDVDSSDPQNPIVSSDFSAASIAVDYTLSVANGNQWMDTTGAGPINIECPPESDEDLGDKFVHVISNYSAGVVTVVAGIGVTVHPPAGGTLVIPQYGTAGIKKADNAADTYIVFGQTVSV